MEELLNDDGQWEPQQLSFSTPGFRIYLISLLLCQLVYLVANAQERQIPLERVEADVVVTTSSDWIQPPARPRGSWPTRRPSPTCRSG